MPKGFIQMSEELQIDVESEEFKADPVAYFNKLHNQQVEGLKSKRDELLKKISTQKPVDTSELESLREFKSKADIQAEELKGNYDKALQMATESSNKKIAEAEERASTLQASMEKLLIDNGLAAALDAVKVMPEAKQVLTDSFRLRSSLDGDKAMIGDKSLSEAIGEWAKTDEAKPFLQAPNNQGGGAQGGDSSPPTKKFSEMGSDERTALYRENPEEYQRLRDAEQPQRKF